LDVVPEKGWDFLWGLATAAMLGGWFPFMAVDAERFRWSHLGAVWQVVGAVSVITATGVAASALLVNSYASAVVRVQRERGQQVVASGPYAVVRHPIYAGVLWFFPGTALLLGSGYGLALSPLLMAMVVARTAFEDRVLHRELEGYVAYAERVRWRLIPGVW
jgi:protein-S-isoprenylcysteine O-methyltransferase Ste14